VRANVLNHTPFGPLLLFCCCCCCFIVVNYSVLIPPPILCFRFTASDPSIHPVKLKCCVLCLWWAKNKVVCWNVTTDLSIFQQDLDGDEAGVQLSAVDLQRKETLSGCDCPSSSHFVSQVNRRADTESCVSCSAILRPCSPWHDGTTRHEARNFGSALARPCPVACRTGTGRVRQCGCVRVLRRSATASLQLTPSWPPN
jgi:hypothetical protein